jgi:hypothetical protein
MSSKEEFFDQWATAPARRRDEFTAPPAPDELTTTADAYPAEPPARRQAMRSRQARRARPAPPRRVKRTIKRIDPISVLKLSLFFYAAFLLLWLSAVAVLYAVVDSFGLFDTIEKFGRGFVLFEEVNITLGLVEKWAFLIGLTLVVLGSFVNLVLAFLYNIAADLLGGVDITFSERD